MELKLDYSFHDELVSKFYCDLNSKKLELHFEAYSDLLKNEYVESDCIWTIENWTEAKSTVGVNPKLLPIDTTLGIFYLRLDSGITDNNELEIFVNTIDGRYLNIFFKEPTLTFKSKEYP
jgi:hypothetical protein